MEQVQQEVKVAGEPIALNGVTYILPPLPLVKMAKVGKLMQGGNFMEDEAYVGSLVDAIHWSLQRNYGKDFQREIVEENLDMNNFQSVMNAFMQVNGFQKKPGQGEAQASQ